MKYKELALALAAEYVELVDTDGPLRQRAVALLAVNRPRGPRGPRGRPPDARLLLRNEEIRQRYQDGATQREIGATFGISAERVRTIVGPEAVAQAKAARRAKREASKPPPIQRICAACLQEFATTHRRRRTCSPLCSEALVVARLYLCPGAHESHRAYMGVGDEAPNRTYSLPNSKVATILRKIGREDLLRISEPPGPRSACTATNADGTPCKRSVINGDVCHIHRRVA